MPVVDCLVRLRQVGWMRLAGDRSFYPLFCEVTDNEIHRVNRVVNYLAGVSLGISDGCWVAHNDLHDLRLAPDSPALRLGFVPIPSTASGYGHGRAEG